MKKILLAVIMVLCFASASFANGGGDFTAVNMSQCQASILGAQHQNMSLFTTGGAFVAGGNLQAQAGLYYTERYGCHSYSSSFAASGQLQAQGVVIIPVREHKSPR